ncbi:Str synth domain-containing protein [Citrus sinensis]|uniref:Str synth domain-containing protein n=1 Tax=Citrus sinensis TaxID=2711 RepID=A0ACB8L6L5_CITSI|nr:Str synth domain-containing protein [Citrus sinensis]
MYINYAHHWVKYIILHNETLVNWKHLLKYDPKSNQTTVLQEGFYFANGIALSKDEDFVVVCESWKFRCRRYWLKGEPDNINLVPDGSFWIALIKMNQTDVTAIQNCSENWELLDAYPGLISLLLPMGSDGAVEFEGNLHLASLQSYFIGKLPLDAPNPELATI